MGIIPGELIAAPEPLRRRYGLFNAASGPLDLSVHGRGGGVRYDPVPCGVAHPYGINCYAGSVVTSEDGKPIDPNSPGVEALPFMVLASIVCGTVGYTSAEDEAKVRRLLMTSEQGGAEEGFWTGLDFEGNALGIVSLANSAQDITLADDDIVTVVAGLEDWAYREQGYGYAAYIHAPASVAAYAAEANLIVTDGDPMRAGRMLTPYGSVWVFGGGYPGTGEAGAAPPEGGSFLHITGQVTVWRAPEEHVYPVDQTMDREANQRNLLAEREYAVAYDCFNGRAEFNPLGSS